MSNRRSFCENQAKSKKQPAARRGATGPVLARKDFRFGHRGHQHPYGLCICCDELRVIFVHIPKNGSSSFRSYFSNFTTTGREVNYFDLPESTRKSYYTFCVLRDVRDRFHSAVNTILSRDQTDISSLSKDNLRKNVDEMVDAHIVRQLEFIDGIRIDYYLPFSKLSDVPVHKNSYNKDVKETKMISKIPNRVIDSVYAKDDELLRLHTFNDAEHEKFLQRMRLK